MHHRIFIPLAALALASCGSDSVDSDGDGTISMSEAAAKSDEFIKPDPGRYRVTAEIVDVQIPGAPQEMQDMMKSMMSGDSQSHEYCLTREEADKGFEEMAKRSQEGDCSFEKFEAEGGSIDAVMLCNDARQGKARMTLQGTGTRTSSDMTMAMDATSPDGKTMKIVMKSAQQRIGDCAA